MVDLFPNLNKEEVAKPSEEVVELPVEQSVSIQPEEDLTADIRKRGRFLSTESRQQLEVEKQKQRQAFGPPIPFDSSRADLPGRPPTPEQIRTSKIESRQEQFTMGGAITGGLASAAVTKGNPLAIATGGAIGGLGGRAVADAITVLEELISGRTTPEEFIAPEKVPDQLKVLTQQYLSAAETEVYYNFGGPVIFNVAGRVLKRPIVKLFGIVKNQAELQKLLLAARQNNVRLALFNTPSKLARFYSKVLGIFPVAGAGIRARFTKQAGEVQAATEDFLDTFGPIVQIDKLGLNLVNRVERSVKSFRNVSSFFYKRFFTTAQENGNPRFIPTVMFKEGIKTLLDSPGQLPKIPLFKNASFLSSIERRTVMLQKRQLVIDRRAERLANKTDTTAVDAEILELDQLLKTIDDEILALKATQGPEGLETAIGPLTTPTKGERVVSTTLENYLQLPEFITVTEFRALQRELNSVGRRAGNDEFLNFVSTTLRDGLETDLQNVARGFTPFRLAQLGIKPEQARAIMQTLSDANDFYTRGKALMNTTAGKLFVKAVPDIFKAGFSKKIPVINPTNLAEKLIKDPNFKSAEFLNDLQELLDFGVTAAKTLRTKVGKRGFKTGIEKPSEKYFSQLTRLFLEKQMTAATTETVLDAAGRKIAFIKADNLEGILGLTELGGISGSAQQQAKEFLSTLFEKAGKSVSVDQLKSLIKIMRAVFESPVSDPSVFAARRITLQGLRNPGNYFENLGQALAPAAKIGTTVGGVSQFGLVNFGAFIITIRALSRIITQPQILDVLVNGLKQTPNRQIIKALTIRLAELDPELVSDGMYINLESFDQFDFEEILQGLNPADFLQDQASKLEAQLNDLLGPP